ncbi:ANTAR domain-containing protein [Rahnella sp. SAP-1]|uniref:ANTAR domain-containing protein n=1 Tax=Rouxiella aceris TaxID=2703884 RepID=A0A848MM75_9GAMM|nr:nitrate regulatory protein [Rouxiella aceris]NMP28150.1 ANTAR domain-containing protein [Rouxiella aceris]
MTISALNFVLASKKSEITSLQQMLQMGKLVGAVSQLIHVLQRERGTANIYLCSQGQYFAEQLGERALQVQLAEQGLMAQLSALDLSGQYITNASRLFSCIATVLHGLTTLPELRQQVAARTIEQPAAMDRYCQVIRSHLSLVFEAADTSADPAIARALLAMFSFMQGKELAGQERALAAAGFAARYFDEPLQQQLVALIDGQDRCFHTFTEFADARCMALWQQQQSVDSSEFERFRRVACTRVTPGSEPNDVALRWFAVTTARIDGMKQVEDLLEDMVMECCQMRLAQAEKAQQLQQLDIALIDLQMPQQSSRYAVFISEPAGQPNHDHYQTDGLSPQLSRSILDLVEQQSRQLQALDAELVGLRASLVERKQVEQAKGLLMQHRGLSEQQAHKTLRDMAMNQNKKLAEIAAAMLSVADLLSGK